MKDFPHHTVAEAWADCRQTHFGDILHMQNAEKYVADFERVFYAGAATMFELVKQSADGDTVEGCRRLDGLAKEISDYAEKVVAEAKRRQEGP